MQWRCHVHRWIDKAGWGLAVALALAFIAVFAREAAGGPLDPPGAPASTVSQIEPRQPIPPPGWDGTFPIEINELGSYYVTQRLFQNGSAITIDINVAEVTLDLNGFAVAANNFAPAVIDAAPGAAPIIIRNGSIFGGVKAINVPQGQSTFEDLFIVTNNAAGIAIDAGDRTVIRNVQVEAGNGGHGIQLGALSRVSDCIVDQRNQSGTAGIAIDVGTQGVVERCTIEGAQIGIRAGSASRVTDCDVRSVQTGIDAGSGAAVERCTIGVYEFEGIKVGNSAKVTENEIDFNSPFQATSCAIEVNGTFNRIDSNVLVSYVNVAGAKGVCLNAGGNTVHRNNFYEAANAVTGAAGNDVGPLDDAATATSPWANVVY
jgi:hypothetical protein